MLLILPVLLGVILALLRGGSLQHLATLRVRGVSAIVASFVIQAVIYVPAVRDLGPVREHGAAIYLVVLALMVFGVASNWGLGLAARLVLLGLALNTAVVVANGGHMPVNAAALRAEEGLALVRTIAAHKEFANRMLADRSSRLVAFSDTLPVSLPFGHGSVCSFGDLFIMLGGGALAYGATRRRDPRQADALPQAVKAPAGVRPFAG